MLILLTLMVMVLVLVMPRLIQTDACRVYVICTNICI